MSQNQSRKLRTQRTLRLRKTIFSKLEYFCNKCNARCYLVLQTKGDGKTYVLSTTGWDPSAEQLVRSDCHFWVPDGVLTLPRTRISLHLSENS